MRSAIRASEFRRIPFLDRIVTVVQAENFDLKEAKSDALNDPPMAGSCGEAKPFGLSSPTKEKQKNGETCRERCWVTKNATRGTRVAILSILTRSHVDEPLNRLVTPTTTGVCFFFAKLARLYSFVSLYCHASQAIKSALATLKNNVDTLHKEKDDAVNASQTTDQKEQIQRVLDKLRDEWTLLNKAYTDKQR